MTDEIGRRRFLRDGARAMIGASLLPLSARVPTRAAPCQRRSDPVPELEKLIPQLMREGVVPGVAIALIRDGRLAWRRAFGVRDAASRVPVDDDTVFEIASVSKTVFAYAVMQLVDRGTMALDTPLTAYTPERILTGDPRLDMITARRVLSHTTGFQDWRSSREPLRIAFIPGEKFSYSGEGYWYLQSVVTHLTGKVDRRACGRYEANLEVCATDIDPYMKAHVLRPFGMTSSGYVWDDDLERHTARPHDAAGKPLEKHRPTAIDAARYAAAGGLNATATDYARFLIQVIAPRARDAFHLAADTRREMLRPQAKVDESHSWGLGWEIRHTPAGDLIQHQGGQSGFQAFTAASVERRTGYVILTNSDNGYKVYYDRRFTNVMERFLLA